MSNLFQEQVGSQIERLINIITDITNLLPDSDKKLEILDKLKDEAEEIKNIQNTRVETYISGPIGGASVSAISGYGFSPFNTSSI